MLFFYYTTFSFKNKPSNDAKIKCKIYTLKYFNLHGLIPSGYENDFLTFCEFVKIGVFVGFYIISEILILRTFVYFFGKIGEFFSQLFPNSIYTFVWRNFVFCMGIILILRGEFL